MGKPKGSKVVLLEYEPPMVVTVKDLLASQFTAVHPDTGTLTFRFYNDEGLSWQNYSERQQS